jgi:hypothetical protein
LFTIGSVSSFKIFSLNVKIDYFENMGAKVMKTVIVIMARYNMDKFE